MLTGIKFSGGSHRHCRINNEPARSVLFADSGACWRSEISGRFSRATALDCHTQSHRADGRPCFRAITLGMGLHYIDEQLHVKSFHRKQNDKFISFRLSREPNILGVLVGVMQERNPKNSQSGLTSRAYGETMLNLHRGVEQPGSSSGS